VVKKHDGSRRWRPPTSIAGASYAPRGDPRQDRAAPPLLGRVLRSAEILNTYDRPTGVRVGQAEGRPHAAVNINSHGYRRPTRVRLVVVTTGTAADRTMSLATTPHNFSSARRRPYNRPFRLAGTTMHPRSSLRSVAQPAAVLNMCRKSDNIRRGWDVCRKCIWSERSSCNVTRTANVDPSSGPAREF
jgi:hypothetical protein